MSDELLTPEDLTRLAELASMKFFGKSLIDLESSMDQSAPLTKEMLLGLAKAGRMLELTDL